MAWPFSRVGQTGLAVEPAIRFGAHRVGNRELALGVRVAAEVDGLGELGQRYRSLKFGRVTRACARFKLLRHDVPFEYASQ